MHGTLPTDRSPRIAHKSFATGAAATVIRFPAGIAAGGSTGEALPA